MATLQLDTCIEACNACALACAHCASSCLRETDPKSMARCIQLDLDCAAICRLAADAMARNSENIQAICSLCADLCDICGEECMQHRMEHCQACAVACKRCALDCRSMVGQVNQMAQGVPSGGSRAHH